MIIDAAMRESEKTLTSVLRIWFLRIMAVICFVSALAYWSQLLGMARDPGLRFDLINPLWRSVSTVLAVILPVASLGLWLTANWGIVVWLIAIAIECAVYGWWADIFAAKPSLVVGHAASFISFMLISGVFFFQQRKARLSLH